MRLYFLGTGTSFGVPVIGCSCPRCISEDPRDARTRHGAVLESDDGARRLLVDTPPELRLQLLRAGIDNVDAVWFTHAHADHAHGLDDLRAFSARREPVIAHASAACERTLRRRFDYIFDPEQRPQAGTTMPELRLQAFDVDAVVETAGFRLHPLEVPHGRTVAHGFRVGELGYVTDAKSLPDAVRERLRGVRVLVLNALWFGNPHPTHFNVDEAVAAAGEVGADITYLTHITHRVSHAELLERLPPSVRPAYDGLIVEV